MSERHTFIDKSGGPKALFTSMWPISGAYPQWPLGDNIPAIHEGGGELPILLAPILWEPYRRPCFITDDYIAEPSFRFIQSIYSFFYKVKDLFFHEWIWYDKKRIIYFPFQTSTVLNHVGWICLALPCSKNFLLTTKFQQNLLYHGIPQQASLISFKRSFIGSQWTQRSFIGSW